MSNAGAPSVWIPLLPIGEGGTSLGVSREGVWMVGDAASSVPITADAALVRMLVLLEGPADSVERALTAALISSGVSASGSTELPLQTAVKAGLSARSDYWASHALVWLESVAATPEIRDLLRAVEKASWASQRTRHKAASLVRR